MDEESIDLSWAEDQIAAARVPIPVGKATLALLRVWAELPFNNEQQQDKTLQLFAKLARSQSVAEADGLWKPVHVGGLLQIGDIVRVRADAFKDAAGRTHNGRVGRVLAKRSGDVIVRSTDGREPYLEASHYPPAALEVKVG